jgi:hypothetical protein
LIDLLLGAEDELAQRFAKIFKLAGREDAFGAAPKCPAPLFLGVRGLFLNVTSSRSKKCQRTETEKRSPLGL